MNEIYVAVGTFAVTFLIGWGMNRATLVEHERRVSAVEMELAKQHEVFVSYRHFNEIMTTVRDAQKELRDDMKQVLDMVGKLTRA